MSRLTPRNIELADDDAIAMFRRMSFADKLRVMNSMYNSARKWVDASVRRQHPGWSEAQLRREIARRLSHGEIDGPV
jgi:hypothetical protein